MFDQTRTIPVVSPSLGAVVKETVEHFEKQGYTSHCGQTVSGGWQISLTKGGTFKAVLGLKTALNAQITPQPDGTAVHLSIGIFGREVVPTAIMLFIAWPLMIIPIWGMVKQYQLDEELLAIIEARLRAHSVVADQKFCTECGAVIDTMAQICPRCGGSVGQSKSDHADNKVASS